MPELLPTTIAPPSELTNRERKRWAALHRRMNHLEQRVANYRGSDPHRQIAEAGAIRWALRTIASFYDDERP